MSEEFKVGEVVYVPIGINCIICDNFIKLENSYFKRSNEYICQDCKNVIQALKQVGVQKILELSKDKSEKDV